MGYQSDRPNVGKTPVANLVRRTRVRLLVRLFTMYWFPIHKEERLLLPHQKIKQCGKSISLLKLLCLLEKIPFTHKQVDKCCHHPTEKKARPKDVTIDMLGTDFYFVCSQLEFWNNSPWSETGHPILSGLAFRSFSLGKPTHMLIEKDKLCPKNWHKVTQQHISPYPFKKRTHKDG